jgi:hypothetical protein
MLLLESLIFQESPDSVENFFNSLSQEQEVVKTMRPSASKRIVKGKAAKRLFAKLADMRFMDSLVTIHWGSRLRKIESVLKAPSNSEISCNAVRGKIPHEGEMGRFGLVVKGHITFLANDMDDVHSGSYTDYVPDPEVGAWAFQDKLPRSTRDKQAIEWYKNFVLQRKKTSGINKGLDGSLHSVVLDEEDFEENQNNEALVDHWKPLAIIVPGEDDKEEARKFTKLFIGLPHEVSKYLGL